MKQKIHVPPHGPPKGQPPSKQIYEAMKEEGIFNMLADLYRLLSTSRIGHMFPQNDIELLNASKKSAAFFVQIAGGPPMYNQQFGPPKMRARHIPFLINDAAKNEWLRCFFEVLDDAPKKFNFPPAHIKEFKTWLTQFAAWMVNSED